MEAQFVLEVHRLRVSSQVIPSNASRRLVAHLEGQYRNKAVRSAEVVVGTGSQLALPWSSRLDTVTLRLFYIEERLKTEIGSAVYEVGQDKSFDCHGYGGGGGGGGGRASVLLLHLLPRGGSAAIGKVQCSVCVMYLYDKADPRQTAIATAPLAPATASEQKTVAAGGGGGGGPSIGEALPDFRFKRLSKTIDWPKIRAVEVDRLAATRDVVLLRTFLDDVALGDVAMEDCDPLLLKAMQLTQFSTQYLLSSKKALQEKRHLVSKALDTFQQEEDLLDMKIAKLKAKKRGMRKELVAMDEIADSYLTALARFDVELAQAAEKSYLRSGTKQQQTRRDSHSRSHHRGQRRRRRHGDGESESHSEEEEEEPRSSRGGGGGGKRSSKGLPLVSIPPKPRDDWVRATERERRGSGPTTTATTSEIFKSQGVARDWRDQHKKKKEEVEEEEEVDLPDASSLLPLNEKRNDYDSDSDSDSDAVRGPTRYLSEHSGDDKLKAMTMPVAVLARREVRSVVVGSQSMQSLLPSSTASSYVAKKEEQQEEEEVESPTDNSRSLAKTQQTERETSQQQQQQIAHREVSTTTTRATNSGISGSGTTSVGNSGNSGTGSGSVAVVGKSQTVRQSLQSVASAMSADSLTLTTNTNNTNTNNTNTSNSSSNGNTQAKAGSASSLTISTAPPPPATTTTSTTTTTTGSTALQRGEQKSVDSSLIAEELGSSWYPYSPQQRRQKEQEQEEEEEEDPFDSPVRQPRATLMHSNAIDTSHSVIVDYSEGPASASLRQAAIRFEDTLQSDGSSNSPAFIKGRGLGGQRGRGGGGGGEDDMVLMGTAQLTTTTQSSSSALDRDSLANDEEDDDEEKRFFGGSTGLISAGSGGGGGGGGGGTINSDNTGKLSIADYPANNDSRMDESFSAVLSTLSWTEGRAPVDLLELASALEVNIGAISLTRSKLPPQVQDVHVTVEFLDTRSHPSRSIHLDAPDAIYSLSFTTHLTFDENTSQTLTEEIDELGDTLAVNVNVYDSRSGSLLGQGVVELWNMIEHHCNILRQEVDVYTYDMTAIIGLLVVDVKGYMLMTKCAG